MTRTARFSFNQKESAVMKNVASSWKDLKQQQKQSFKATDKIKKKKMNGGDGNGCDPNNEKINNKKQLISKTHISNIAADWADLSIADSKHKTVDFSIGKNNNNTPENNPKNNDDNNRNYNTKQNFTNNKKSKRKLSTKEINNETTNNGRSRRDCRQIEADGKRTNQFEKRKNSKPFQRLNGSMKRQLNKPCFQCRQVGHMLADCPNSSSGTGLCFKCGSTEHTYRECKVIKGNNFKNAVCFICSKTGHISKQCPKNTNGLYPNGGSCNLCGKNDHLCRDCPGLNADVEKPVVYAGLRNDNVEMLD